MQKNDNLFNFWVIQLIFLQKKQKFLSEKKIGYF